MTTTHVPQRGQVERSQRKRPRGFKQFDKTVLKLKVKELLSAHTEGYVRESNHYPGINTTPKTVSENDNAFSRLRNAKIVTVWYPMVNHRPKHPPLYRS
jgi:hypothetical protein